MKSNRQGKILEIIDRYNVETQEELISRLKEAGFDVTQATISRDIRELKLTKVLSVDGKYKYILNKAAKSGSVPNYKSTLSASIVSIEYAQNLIVIKTFPGMAQAIAAILDSAHIKGVMGSVAGDDTIIAATRETDLTAIACEEIKKLLEK